MPVRVDRRLLVADPRGTVEVLAASGAALAGALLLIVQLVLLARAVAAAFDGAGHTELRRDALAIALVVLARAALVWMCETAGRSGAQRLMSALRMELAAGRIAAPAPADHAESADVAVAAVHGADQLQVYFVRYLPQLVLAVTIPVCVLAVAAVVDLESALVMLVTLPVIPVFMVLLGRLAEARARARWAELTALSGHFLDVLSGLATLRAFNRGAAQAERIAEVDERYRATTMATLRVAFLSGAVLDLAAVLGTALVAVTLGVRLDDGRIGLEPALIVLMLTPELYAPLRGLAAQFHASADGLAGAERMLEMIAAPPSPRSTGVAVPQLAGHGVCLEDVSFAYPGRDVRVLDRVSLVVEPGETVVLAGPSGSGKSTVGSLLMGFCDPLEGCVRCGAADLSRCDLDAWRRQIAWLPQRPAAISGSVGALIAMGDPSAGRARIEQATHIAGADAVIRGLPDGYDTQIGEGGRRLSPGELRRVALARALLRRAPLVILDEPTADLDGDAAELVAAAVERLAGTCGVLVMSHQPQRFAGARVVQLEWGRVVSPVPEPVA